MTAFTESVVEDATLAWLESLGWTIRHGPDLSPGSDTITLPLFQRERESYSEVVLAQRLRDALARLNPALPPEVLDDAFRKLTRPEGSTLEARNRAVHRLLVDGVTVEYRAPDGSIRGAQARVIDFNDADNNDWLVVNQFTVTEGQATRRADVVAFVNGLPLAVIELKNPTDEEATIWTALNQLQTYKRDIPSLFTYNEVMVISDGVEARLGSLTAPRERFAPWRTIEGEELAPATMARLEVLIRGVFDKSRFLDLIRHFVVFEQDGEAVTKILAGYHQFHATRVAIETTLRAASQDGDRRAGVVWHTQGSGKSLTMVFYAGKLILHPEFENPTIVVLTDRNDLDGQLFGVFSRCREILRQTPVQAESRAHLRDVLRVVSGGVIFTTIQKFMPPEVAPSPQPSPTGRGSADSEEVGGHYRGGYDFAGLVERARELRQQGTRAEEILWSVLRNRQLWGAKFRRQHQIGDYICDFYCDSAKLVVEADGGVHHEDDMKRHDQKRDAYLRSLGYTVLRIPNDRILGDSAAVLQHIADHLPSPSGRGEGGEGPLSLRRNIVVIADEAHRSQYDFIDGYARHMRDALPNASFIGFTGTPIELEDKNTRAVFGDYVSIYDIQRAVDDGATVSIYYEGRLAKLDLPEEEKPRLDEEFEEVTEGEEEFRKERLKSKWAALEAVVGTEKRLSLIARDLVDHFERRLEAMDGKAMVVCMSRRICVDLYRAIVKLRPAWHADEDDRGSLKIVMTGSASDPEEWQPHIRNKLRREFLAKRLKKPADPFRIVLVRDMWLTGFDAPCLHSMYVDKPMRGHGLMQAIARVNRVFRDKPGGLVVDYLGLADSLRRALAVYTESGGKGSTAIDQDEAVAVMLEKYEICRDMFHGFDYSAYLTGTPAQRLSILPAAQEHILAQQDGKERFVKAVDDLSKAFALAVPRPEALAIRDDVAFFQAVKAALVKSTLIHARPEEELDHAIRQIVSRAIAPEGVIDLFAAAGLKKPDISILSDEFLAEVRAMPHKNLAVELLRRLINDELNTRRRKNLVQSRSFAEMLDQTIRRYQNRAIETVQVIEELIRLAKEMREARGRGEHLKLTEEELAFYDALETNDSAVRVLGEPVLCQIARELAEIVRQNTTIDWTVKESARANLRRLVRRLLRKYNYPPDKQEKATLTVLEQAELLSKEMAA